MEDKTIAGPLLEAPLAMLLKDNNCAGPILEAPSAIILDDKNIAGALLDADKKKKKQRIVDET